MDMAVTKSGVVSTGPPTVIPAAFLLLEGVVAVVPEADVEVEVAVEEAAAVFPALLVLLLLPVPSAPPSPFWDPTPFKPGPMPAPLARN